MSYGFLSSLTGLILIKRFMLSAGGLRRLRRASRAKPGAIHTGDQRGSVSRSTSPAYRYAPVLEKPLRVTDVTDPRSAN